MFAIFYGNYYKSQMIEQPKQKEKKTLTLSIGGIITNILSKLGYVIVQTSPQWLHQVLYCVNSGGHISEMP